MNKIVSGILFLITIYLMACAHKTDRQKLYDFLNDPANHLTQKLTIGKIQASMQWMPQKVRDTSSIETSLYYFRAKLDKHDGEKPSKEKTLYLDFDMQNDFVMLQDADSLHAMICQKVENGIAGSYEYMLAFEANPNKDFSILYNDKIFGIGSVAFAFQKNELEQINKLTSSLKE